MRFSKLVSIFVVFALALTGSSLAATPHHAKPKHAAGKKKPPKPKPKPKPKPPKVTVLKNQGPFPKPNPPADTSTPCANTTVVADPSNVAVVKAAILCLVNQERAKAGVGALKPYPVLDAVAQAYGDVVVAQNNYSHTGPDGSTPDTRVLGAGYVAANGNYAVGENLGVAEGPLATAASLVTAWMNSPEHKANILNATFQESGVGITMGVPASQSSGAPTGATFVQDFGVRGTDLVRKIKTSSGITF